MDIKDANKKLQNVEEKVDNIYGFCSKLIDRNYKTSRSIITVLVLVIIVLLKYKAVFKHVREIWICRILFPCIISSFR